MPYLMSLTELDESMAGVTPESAAIVVMSADEFEALLHSKALLHWVEARRDEPEARPSPA